ncbi:hypothetical protein GGF41_004661, partial [Coemansia sp. RSA 2531]
EYNTFKTDNSTYVLLTAPTIEAGKDAYNKFNREVQFKAKIAVKVEDVAEPAKVPKVLVTYVEDGIIAKDISAVPMWILVT